jgi:hypothetical protein
MQWGENPFGFGNPFQAGYATYMRAVNPNWARAIAIRTAALHLDSCRGCSERSAAPSPDGGPQGQPGYTGGPGGYGPGGPGGGYGPGGYGDPWCVICVRWRRWPGSLSFVLSLSLRRVNPMGSMTFWHYMVVIGVVLLLTLTMSRYF